MTALSSHLFQRVASFLLIDDQGNESEVSKKFSSLSESGFIPTKASFSRIHRLSLLFSSLSESGFIPTGTAEFKELFRNNTVLISFREWLHSYPTEAAFLSSFYFFWFSSLSESGFIPTLGFHDCLSMRFLEREKGNLRNLVLV